MLTFGQLLKSDSETAIRNFIFEAAGLDPALLVKTSMRGSVIWGSARGIYVVQSVLVEITKGGQLGLSRGVWLDILGVCYYQDPRLEALPAIRNAVLSLPIGASPVNVPSGTRIQEKVSGREWYVSDASPGTITAGSSQPRVLTSAMPGEAGNVPPSTALTSTIPALVLTFVNAAAVQSGVERESDDRYTKRLMLKWSLNTYAVGPRAYERIALDVAPSVSRARVRINYPTFNQIRIALRRANGPALPEDVALVNARALEIAAANDEPEAEIAPTNVKNILARPRIRRGTSTAAQCVAALRTARDSMPIGGIKIQGTDAGRLLRDYLAQSLSCQLNGVTSAGIITPETDTVLGPNEIVGGTITVEPEFYDWIE